MSYQFLTYAVAERVATITINRPDKLNALNDATMEELGHAVEGARSSADVGGIIVTGAGRAFVAGADIGELRSRTAAQAHTLARRGQDVFRRIETSPKPVIAAVNGFALGGGCELAMACTLRIAADTARLGQPEINLGLMPGYGGSQRLPRLVGKGRALELLLTGDPISADEAWRIGLVNRVVPAASLLDEARALARSLAAKAPIAVRYILDAVHQGGEMGLAEAQTYEATLFGLVSTTEDMREGTTAFLEKRKAAFKGR